jgi:predicted hydrolase (HD superfamily)
MNETNNKEAAWQLLTEFTQSENLPKHALAVEPRMRRQHKSLIRPLRGKAFQAVILS